MKVKFRTQCRVKVDSLLLYEVEECELVESVPFEPAVGHVVKLPGFSGFTRIASIGWDAENPKYLIAWLAEPESHDRMPWAETVRNGGWAVAR